MKRTNFERNFASLGILIGLALSILIYSTLFIIEKIGINLISFKWISWRFIIVSGIVSAILGEIISIFSVNKPIKKNTHLKLHLILFVILLAINLFFILIFQFIFNVGIIKVIPFFKIIAISILIYLIIGFVFDRIVNYFYKKSIKIALILRLTFLIFSWIISLGVYSLNIFSWLFILVLSTLS